ncbi:MAG: LuxR C-terminal-related transcriptional regulator [Oscillospiraceae bacterium]|nr:LuxR C-terminal-related transcriptional regulator [Oscillospiraceae bacterium]
MNQSFNGDSISFRQSGDFLKRSRLQKLLTNAMDYPLIAVYAGAGYGKTLTVYSFLQGYSASIAWMQVSERDNNPTRFWENYTHMISLSTPEISKRLLEIGFPETDEAFAKYGAIIREVGALPGNHIRVFDDFHLLHNPVVRRFAERAISKLASNMTVILISRTEPDVNLIGMMMIDRVFTIREDTLCFTEDEIAEYFSQLGLSVTRQDTRNIYEDTRGWAFAVSMIGRSLMKEGKYERYALEAMKKNIFKLIETEISNIIAGGSLWRFLLRISLIDHLAASLLETIAELENDNMLVKEMEQMNAYIRYDFNLDTYLIHPLFLDYLRQNQHILTTEEKRDTYQKAGDWCNANGYLMDAFSYYEKSGDYMKVALKLLPDSLQIPKDMALYALKIFDNVPKTEMFSNIILPSMYLKLQISLGQLDEAAVFARKCIEQFEAQPESVERNRGMASFYGHWGLALRNNCTYTDVYDFDFCFRKMGEYYDRTPFEAFGKYPSMLPIAWASLVGVSRSGALEDYIGAISRCIPDVPRVMDGLLTGYDNLLWGELYFYRGEFNDAEQHLRQSIDKAITFNQYLTQSKALAYLMEIAFLRGDLASATTKLHEIETLNDIKDYDIRFETYDIAYGFYHLLLKQPDQVPEWLKGNFSTFAHPSFLENYGNRVKMLYHYETHQYSALLAFIENALEQQTILFGEIELNVFKALSLYRLKRRDEAIATLIEAYKLAEPNTIIIPFIQFGKDMRTLTAATLKDSSCTIPKIWLEDINRKASAFAKRWSHIISEYMNANNIDKEINLTNRETEILRDLSQGLSRVEIAVSQNISPNTVKMMINIIYDKLHANSMADAIRIAVNRKII